MTVEELYEALRDFDPQDEVRVVLAEKFLPVEDVNKIAFKTRVDVCALEVDQ